jgi:hypothetical protein
LKRKGRSKRRSSKKRRKGKAKEGDHLNLVNF